MNTHIFFLHALLFALGALAINDKGTIYLCTAVNNVETEDWTQGTQVNIAVKNVAQESLSSICGNLNKYIKDKKNGFSKNGGINCATNDDRTMMVGVHVPLDTGKQGQDAAKMLFKALRTVIDGDIELQLFNDQDSDICLLINYDQSAVDAGHQNSDTTTIFPGATINLFLGSGDTSPWPFEVDSVMLSKSAAGLSIPDSQTFLSELGPVTDSLTSQSPVAGVTDILVGGNWIKMMYDLGGPYGFTSDMVHINSDSWTALIMQIVKTIAQGGNQNACLGMTATAKKFAPHFPSSLSMVLTFCFS